ncbi:MAG: hypothetical protein ACRD08_02110 [Acidimicrobiales bacterium]
MRPSHRLRQVINVINLSTALGLLIALLGRARFQRGPDGLLLAKGYRLPVPPAPAFTVGNVVMLRISDERLARRPRLLVHEGRHSTQYAWCLGPVMLVLYVLAAALSWVLTGDPASRNVFERHAGLKAGGYIEKPLRPMFRRRTRSGTF